MREVLYTVCSPSEAGESMSKGSLWVKEGGGERKEVKEV